MRLLYYILFSFKCTRQCLSRFEHILWWYKAINSGGAIQCTQTRHAQCREGLTCVVGFRVKQEKSKVVRLTYSGFHGWCLNLPYTPGLECRERFLGGMVKICVPTRVVASTWQQCGYKQVKEIASNDDLACRVNCNGLGKLLCRPRANIVEFCNNNDSHCHKGLKCAGQTDSTCYNAEKMLLPGDKCCPPELQSDRHCVSKLSSGFGRRCLAKGNGLACPAAIGLFGMCDSKKNWICGDRRQTCSTAGIFVSRNWVLHMLHSRDNDKQHGSLLCMLQSL